MATVVQEAGWENQDALQHNSRFALCAAQLHNPLHPEHTEDSIAALSFAGGEGFALIAADGMSSGGKDSKHAADFITEEISRQLRYFTSLPLLSETDELLFRALYTAADKTYDQLITPRYNALVHSLGEHFATIEANNVGSTVCAAIRCLDENYEPVIRIAARGDSCCYAFDIRSGALTLVFPNREILDSHHEGLLDWVSRYHVGEMEGEKKGLFTYTPDPDREEIIFTVTDGWDIMPDDVQKLSVQRAFHQAFVETGTLPSQVGGNFMQVFTKSLMDMSAEYMSMIGQNFPENPPVDDVSIAAVYMPQLKDVAPPLLEMPLPLTPESFSCIRVLSAGEAILADERHAQYCAGSAATGSFANGKGTFVAVADGIGKERAYAVAAVQQVIADVRSAFAGCTSILSLEEGMSLLREILMKSANRIQGMQRKYREDRQYLRNLEFQQQIDSMGAAASIGITCFDSEGNTVLLCANRGDCEIKIINTEAFASIRTVTKPDTEGNHLTRSVRPRWIAEMKGFMGKGFTVSRLPEHAIILATSNGWRKLVPQSQQAGALRDYYALACEDPEGMRMQTFADCFAWEAQTAWSDSPLIPRDDISAAAIEIVTHTPQKNERRRVIS